MSAARGLALRLRHYRTQPRDEIWVVWEHNGLEDIYLGGSSVVNERNLTVLATFTAC